jgi:hypothetical protein
LGQEEEGMRALQKSACINKGMTAKEAEQAIRKHEQQAKKKALREQKAQGGSSAGLDGADEHGRIMTETGIKARDDGRSEQERWNLAQAFLTQDDWQHDGISATPPLSLTYMMRTRGVCWRARDEEGDWEWQPYCAGRRKPGIEEESDF